MSHSPRPAIDSLQHLPPYHQGKSTLIGVTNPIKLSSNENPFGASPATIAAMEKAISKQHRYPDGSCTDLRHAIAERYHLHADNIICGAGSDELLHLLCQGYARKGNEVIYSQHGFLIYPIATYRVGAQPIVAAEANLTTNVDAILAKVTENTTMVFIANPNNPTGSYLPKQELLRLRNKLPPHIVLVIDGAYSEYVTADDYSSGLEMVENHFSNVVVTRTFSKIYGLGGLRLGWCYAPTAIADILNRLRGPFNVSSIAQIAGIAALNDRAFETESCEHNQQWRKKLTDEITALNHNFIVHPSAANFLLIDCPYGNAKAVDEHLQHSGILVRRMEAYGLPSCLRITIGTAEENTSLLRAFQQYTP